MQSFSIVILCALFIGHLTPALAVHAESYASMWSNSRRRHEQRAEHAQFRASAAVKSSEITDMQRKALAQWQEQALVSACWRDAVRLTHERCKQGAPESERSGLALRLMNCQLESDGKSAHDCPAAYDVSRCVAGLGDSLYVIYIQFRLHLDSLCFYIGEELARERMQSAADDLNAAAALAGESVRRMEQRSTEIETSLATASAAILKKMEAQVLVSEGQLTRVGELAAALEDHTTASVLASRVHEEQVLAILRDSGEQLAGSRHTLGAIVDAAGNLSQHTERQHQRLAASSGEILGVLDRVYGMQRTIADTFAIFQLVGVYTLMMGVVLVATMPARAAQARPFAVITVTIFAYVEAAHLWSNPQLTGRIAYLCAGTPLLSSFFAPRAYDSPSLAVHAHMEECVRLWRRLCVLAAGIAIAAAAVRFESAEDRVVKAVLTAFSKRDAETLHHPTAPSTAPSTVKATRSAK